MLIDLDGKYLGGTYRVRYGNCEQSDGAATGDSDGFGCDLAGEDCVHGIAERVEDGGVLLRDFGVEFPDVRFGDDNVFGEGAVGVHADDFHVLADVGFTGAALQAFSAGDVHFRGNEVTFFHAGDFVTEGDDFAAEFVAGNEGRVDAALGPAIPFINMKVGAADGGYFDFYEDVGTSEAWDFDLANVHARRGLRLDDRQHAFGHPEKSFLRRLQAEIRLLTRSLAGKP